MSRKEKTAGELGSSSWSVIVAVALGLALGIQAFLVKPYRIPSESMVPTLEIGQRVLVNRIGNRLREPDDRRGHGLPPAGRLRDEHLRRAPPGGAGLREAHRRQGRRELHQAHRRRARRHARASATATSIRNGKRAEEPYIRPCEPGSDCNFPTPITIPADHYFMMGDNRGESDDSRFWGPVPRSWIIGGAFATYWPPKRIGLL